MNRRFMETAIGAIVLLVAAWFLFFAYGSGDLGRAGGTSLNAKFNSVGGLAPGNDVRIGGVKVGSVISQRIDPADFRALVTFTVRADLRLPEDTVAAIASDGLLGGKYLRLEPGRSQQTVPAGGAIKQTRDALALEDLLGKAIFLLSDEPKDKK